MRSKIIIGGRKLSFSVADEARGFAFPDGQADFRSSEVKIASACGVARGTQWLVNVDCPRHDHAG